VGGPCDYCVSPRSKSFFFPFFGGLLFDFGACWDQGLTILHLPELPHQKLRIKHLRNTGFIKQTDKLSDKA